MKNIFSLVEEVRARPYAERQRIGMLFTTSATVVVALVWGIGRFVSFENSEAGVLGIPQENTASPALFQMNQSEEATALRAQIERALQNESISEESTLTPPQEKENPLSPTEEAGAFVTPIPATL